MKKILITSLLAVAAAISAQAQTIWNGATDTLWTTGTNWSTNAEPGSNSATNVQFAGSNSTVSYNRTTALTVAGLTFNSGASAFVITPTGGAGVITLGNTGVVNNSSNLQTIGANLSFGATGSKIVNTANGDITLSGNITGTGNVGTTVITKNGASTLTLSGSSVALGGASATTSLAVSAGTVLVNTAMTLSSGAANLTVASNATLGGNGSIAQAAVVSGRVAPGVNSASMGNLTVSNDVTWNWNANNAWTFQLGTAASTLALANSGSSTQDMLLITGGTSDFLKGTGTGFSFDFGGVSQTGFYKLVNWGGTSTFNGTDFTALNLGGGRTGNFTVDTGTKGLYLEVVPEPVTWTLLAFSLTTVMVLRRRRTH